MLFRFLLSGHTYYIIRKRSCDRLSCRIAPGSLKNGIVRIPLDLDPASILAAPFPPDAVESFCQIRLEDRAYAQKEIIQLALFYIIGKLPFNRGRSILRM